VFLDLASDRYRALPPCSSVIFERLIAGAASAADDSLAAGRFVAQGLLQHQDGVADCSTVRTAVPQPNQSQWETATAGNGGWIRIEILAELACWTLAHRVVRLERLLGWYRWRLRRRATPDPDVDPATILSACRWSARLFSTCDRCVPRSLALATVLHRHGHDADVVVGVHMRPFTAHCWVQAGAVILSDRLDSVLLYTPILVA
jgi:hypothetical protein